MADDQLRQLLGDLPESPSLDAVKLAEVDHPDGYILETWSFDLNGEERVPAYIARPFHPTEPMPLVLVNHSHGGMYAMGKTEMIQPSHYLQSPSYAKTLTEMGCIAACIDMWGFGDRMRKESEMVKEMLWRGKVVWGMMLYDNMRFLDILLERPDVDRDRVAAIGMSMGAMQSWWLAALDERVKIVVDMGGQVDAETLLKQGYLDKHGFYSYIPGLLKHFTTFDIQKRIIPRKRLCLVGSHDRNCPLEGVEILDQALKDAYGAAGVPENWQTKLYGCDHQEPAEMRYDWVMYLKEHLCLQVEAEAGSSLVTNGKDNN